ncbi:flagellar FliJ family protein [Hydrogenibacillus schlegelii]|uniref:Flagellar FliJ protein n=1 Tax=Hydrogenibacillus schlegelii TaxID=1484 RepID=A0A947GAT8_HYDSH|nr:MULTISPECIES: flagellar FliJ family protein [Hydrogenibacillus]MBT9281454.1 flagellar FliJ family protein [Hydrogenibacillus schlegelii]QZA33502.1 flagellar FliJ family protein [Hydrogenibacillus sp. N12]
MRWLERLKRLAEQEKALRELRLREAEAAAREAEARLLARQAEAAAAAAQVLGRAEAGVPAYALLVAAADVWRLREALRSEEAAHRAAMEGVAARRSEVLEKRREVRAYERLSDRVRARAQAEAVRREQAFFDEVAVQGWRRRQGGDDDG